MSYVLKVTTRNPKLTTRNMYSKELMKGTLQTIVLKLLEEQERMYGYEITQKVKALSGDKIILTEGALYPTLHKLVAEGLLTTEKVQVNGRTRKYYSLTQTGNTVAKAKVNEFMEFIKTMRLVLNLKNI